MDIILEIHSQLDLITKTENTTEEVHEIWSAPSSSSLIVKKQLRLENSASGSNCTCSRPVSPIPVQVEFGSGIETWFPPAIVVDPIVVGSLDYSGPF